MNEVQRAQPEIAAPAAPLNTIADTARELAISPRHARDLIASGAITAVRLGRCVRVSRAEIDRIKETGIGG